MERKRKLYTDKFKLDVVREALKELGKKAAGNRTAKKTRISGTGLENDRSEPEGRERTQVDNP